MTRISRRVIAGVALVVAFSVSVTYKLGRKGWRFELHTTPTAARAVEDNAYSDLKVLANVITRVQGEYVDPTRIRPKAMLLEALHEVQRRVPEVVVRPAAGEPEDDPAALDLIVGAPFKDGSGDDPGQAFLYYGPFAGSLLASDADVLVNPTADNDFLGGAVAGIGDVNGDGYDDVALGDYQESSVNSGGGACYVLYGGGI